MKATIYLVAVTLSVFMSFISGCGKGDEPSQLGTTTPVATAEQVTQSEAGSIGAQDEAYQRAKDQALAASEKEYEARMHGAPPHPSEFPFPNPPGEQPIPTYVNFYSINDHYPDYVLCEYQVDKKEYDQLDEPKWFKAALIQVRKSGPKKFPPIAWIAVIVINRAEWNGASTFEEAHKAGAIFKSSDVFNPACDLSELVVHADMERHPFKYDTSQPTPGDQQRWLIVEKHAATNAATASGIK